MNTSKTLKIKKLGNGITRIEGTPEEIAEFKRKLLGARIAYSSLTPQSDVMLGFHLHKLHLRGR